MKFLVTNDDGVTAPGIAALCQALTGLGECVVLAPHEHLSGCSHQATTHKPLTIQSLRDGWHMLDGSPVDCVRVGLRHLNAEFDWVVSGINDGGNLGHDIYLSGTVAAAREACALGKPAIAISQYRRGRTIDWERSARWARTVIEQLISRPDQPGQFWNINLPDPEPSAPQPIWEMCPVDPRPLPVGYELLEGKLHYRGNYHERLQTHGGDISVCFGGNIAVSRISL
jgi:5'-nucleotidase